MNNRGGVVGHSTVHFIDVPQMNSKSGLLYQTEESLKLNLWRLFYRKNTKLSPIYKTLSLPCSMRLNCETKQSQTTLCSPLDSKEQWEGGTHSAASSQFRFLCFCVLLNTTATIKFSISLF